MHRHRYKKGYFPNLTVWYHIYTYTICYLYTRLQKYVLQIRWLCLNFLYFRVIHLAFWTKTKIRMIFGQKWPFLKMWYFLWCIIIICLKLHPTLERNPIHFSYLLIILKNNFGLWGANGANSLIYLRIWLSFNFLWLLTDLKQELLLFP